MAQALDRSLADLSQRSVAASLWRKFKINRPDHRRGAAQLGLALAALWLLWPRSGAEQALGALQRSLLGDPLLLGGLALGGLLLGLTALFLWIFVGPPNPAKVEWMFRFSYCSALLAVLLPFMGVAAYVLVPGLDQTMRRLPIGLVAGCVREAAAGAAPAVAPAGCGGAVPQWVINIGGYLPPAGYPQRAARATDSAEPGLGATAMARELMGSPAPAAALGSAAGALPDTAQRRDGAGAQLAIEGGLVVPLYFVVLSLVGACVSMARRIPEYQRGYASWLSLTDPKQPLVVAEELNLRKLAPFIDSGAGKALLPELVRERLIFQVAQVWAAPLLAIAAYCIFSPQQVSTTVAVGFAAGFAAEPTLLLLRRVTDALVAAGTAGG